MVLRSDFDHALLNMAERRGAELRCGVRVRSVRAADQGARQVRVASDDGVISARMCVLADGAASAISREARILGRFHKHFYGFALRRTPEGIRRPADGPSDTMELFSYPKPGGYAWVFPKAGSANIGVGSWAPKSRKLARDEESVLARLSRDSIYDIQWRQSAVGGAFVPIALTRRRLGRGPVVLAGDAAALVDPVTGEGIYHALESGLIAAQCAAGSLSAPASYSASYAGEVLRAFGLDLVSAFPWVLGRYVFDVFGLGTSRFLVERLARFASDSGAYRRFG
jgi:flavin-dependent dehydrogenase